eukprot:scaffold5127_cov64-Phaeocystis_antarctica.AAC.10
MRRPARASDGTQTRAGGRRQEAGGRRRRSSLPPPPSVACRRPGSGWVRWGGSASGRADRRRARASGSARGVTPPL